MATLNDEYITVGGQTYRLHRTGQRTEAGWSYRLYALSGGPQLAYVTGYYTAQNEWRWETNGATFPGPALAALVTAVLAAQERNAA